MTTEYERFFEEYGIPVRRDGYGYVLDEFEGRLRRLQIGRKPTPASYVYRTGGKRSTSRRP